LTTAKACSACGTDCVKCTSGTICETCSPNYFVNATKGCTKCDDTNCLTCSTGAGVCEVCQPNYFVNASKGCTQCISNCVRCKGITGCD